MYDVILMTANSSDCTKAGALSDWLLWTQTSLDAIDVATRGGVVLASTVPVWSKMALRAVADMRCQGRQVSSSASCISADGVLCSNGQGVCVLNRCECRSGFRGTFCELSTSSSSSDASVILGAVLGSVIPAAVLLVLLLMTTTIVFVIVVTMAQRRRKKEEWEIDMSEIEMGEILGTGGYGQVHRARWRGTEVAVKVIIANDSRLTKEMQRKFADEVRTVISADG